MFYKRKIWLCKRKQNKIPVKVLLYHEILTLKHILTRKTTVKIKSLLTYRTAKELLSISSMSIIMKSNEISKKRNGTN